MNRLARILRISGVLRYLLILVAVALGAAVALTLTVPGEPWVTLGDGQLYELRSTGAIGQGPMLVVLAPIAVVFVLGVYWLQRLFGEYQRGNFFSDRSMRCYIWLVWLKAIAFIYGVVWPLLLGSLSPGGGSADVALSIEAGTIVELIVLLLIVHLLKEAQQIHDENKAFI